MTEPLQDLALNPSRGKCNHCSAKRRTACAETCLARLARERNARDAARNTPEARRVLDNALVDVVDRAAEVWAEAREVAEGHGYLVDAETMRGLFAALDALTMARGGAR